MKILAFAASNAENSINRQLANYAAHLLPDAQVELLDLNDFEMPIFSIQREKLLGQPAPAMAFFSKITEADAIIISFAEHNGSYTAAYKNLFDWTSRIEMKVFQNKPVIMLSTSPGPGGAGSVLAMAVASSPYFGADLKGSLSVPSFFDNFDSATGTMNNAVLKNRLFTTISQLNQ